MYNQSKISVIVPVFNSEKYLHRCVDSILSQTYTDFELLLINDGSTDCCSFICDEYAIKDRRVRVFHKENGGVSSARNLGIENATGEWIAFCDSDDFVESSWLLTYIENSSNVDLVIQGYHNDECGLENFDFEGTSNDVVKQLFIRHVLGYIHTKLFRKRTLLEYHIRFNETVRFREDEDFVLKYLCYNKSVRCVKSGGYNYIMPDLSIKYSYTDNFQVCLSMYSSVCTIYNGEVNIITEVLTKFRCIFSVYLLI